MDMTPYEAGLPDAATERAAIVFDGKPSGWREDIATDLTSLPGTSGWRRRL